MLRDGSASVVEDSSGEAWTGGAMAATAQGREPPPGWQQVHAKLRNNGRQRAALDASEAYWLREAERVQIWKEFGMVSILDYMDRVLGYAPRTARDRLRVARALAHLPLLTESLASEDGLSFSAVKELVRVVTPDTEADWLTEATGKSQREIEELVAGHAPGDHPDDPPDPEVRTRMVSFELSPAPYARLRQAQLVLAEELGHQLDDNELFTALAEAVLARGEAGSGEGAGRAKYQIGLAVCPCCDRASIDVAGVQVPIDDATLAQARCDAQHIGSLDEDTPARAVQDIPPRIRRFIWRRDKARCQTPGCRSKRCLEIHHILAREDGGTHDPSNLTLRCGSCHAAHHQGKLMITGTAPDKLVTTRLRDHRAPVGALAGTATTLAIAEPERDLATPTFETGDSREAGEAGVRGKAGKAGVRGEAVEADIRGEAGDPRGAGEAGVRGEAGVPSEAGEAGDPGEAVEAGEAGDSREADEAGDPGDPAPVGRPEGSRGALSSRQAGVGGGKLAIATLRAQARDALVQLGWKRGIASAAVDEALAHVGTDMPIVLVIREALRRCPRPIS